jgi:hypothetical protein
MSKLFIRVYIQILIKKIELFIPILIFIILQPTHNTIMIYLCQTCGRRINERYNNSTIPSEQIGKHLLYKHMAFCSENCIDIAKQYPHKILHRPVIPYDWNEQGWHEGGVYSNWKIERKLKRKRN